MSGGQAAALLALMVATLAVQYATWRLRAARRIICRDEAKWDGIAYLVWTFGSAGIVTVAGGLVDGLGQLGLLSALGYLLVWPTWRRHRGHEEDCRYGHGRRRRASLPERIRARFAAAVRRPARAPLPVPA